MTRRAMWIGIAAFLAFGYLTYRPHSIVPPKPTTASTTPAPSKPSQTPAQSAVATTPTTSTPPSYSYTPPPQRSCSSSPLPRHGLYKAYSYSDDLARLTIRTSPGSYYFINLEDTYSGQPAMLFFAHGGSTIDSLVPLGNFRLKYASGQTWCGEVDLFGDGTAANEAGDTFLFERRSTNNGYSASHWTVDLIAQKGGNLRTRNISRDTFFGGSR